VSTKEFGIFAEDAEGAEDTEKSRKDEERFLATLGMTGARKVRTRQSDTRPV